MARRSKRGRPLNAVLLLDKPQGLSSNAALQRARRLFDARKAGHTGALDPMATGLLPICFGEATKFSQWGLDADKTYRARVRLGVSTRTGDAEGEIIGRLDAGHIQAADVQAILPRFRGPIEQVPSMFSALKYQGTPLYEYARRGVEIERPPRPVTIHRLQMLNFDSDAGLDSAEEGAPRCAEFDIDVHCSKGTYIRTLAEDMGLELGVGAHLVGLRRTGVSGFDLSQTLTLEKLESLVDPENGVPPTETLLPCDAMIGHLDSVELLPGQEQFFQQGQQVKLNHGYRFKGEACIVRVLSDTGKFLGVGEPSSDDDIRPRRVVVRE